MKKPVFACVLRSGGDYKPEHVQALAFQVHRHTSIPHEFVCYSDVLIPDVKTVPLLENYPGWWSVPEVYRQVGPTVVTGIDTVIRGDLDPLFKLVMDSGPDDFWMINAFRNPEYTASGIMGWNGDWSWLWKEYNYKRSERQFHGEQDYTNSEFEKRGIHPRRFQEHLSGIYSWKKHCRRKIPHDCRVILFHGHPRPHEVPRVWDRITGLMELESPKESNGGSQVEMIWPDSRVYILGGGPSLNQVDLSLLRDEKVLGVNQAIKIKDCPVQVGYSGDRRWYHWNIKLVGSFPGTMYTSYPKFVENPKAPVRNLGRISRKGISDKSPASICWNGNSGASALNVAYWLGAKKIVLLGFDMDHRKGEFNWHSDYPVIKRRSNGRWPNPYPRFMECWPSVAQDAQRLGIQVVNATPGGKLEIFPRKPLEETLSW